MKQILKNYFLRVFFLGILVSLSFLFWPKTKVQSIHNEEPTVKIVQDGGKYILQRHGKPYFIKGAGTYINLRQLKEAGGNSIRIWDSSDATRILDEAQELGLTVNLGIWITRQKEGFSFYNNQLLQDEFKRIRHIVLKYKDHPALLMWSIGNEMSAGNPGIRMWDTLNDLALMIKELDPNHPVTTTIFNVGLGQLKAIQKRCPAIDLVSFNIYGNLPNVTNELKKTSWLGPYIFSEFGAKGYWERPSTSWNEPFEQTSTEKAAFIKEIYRPSIGDMDACLGGYIFYWGHKMEKTPTWFSLLSPEGYKTEIVDVMQYLWTNEWPENTAPGIKSFSTHGFLPYESIIIPPGSVQTSSLIAFDRENDTLRYYWEILPEVSVSDGSVEKQKIPKSIKNVIITNHSDSIQWKAPANRGPYRLYVTVSDGNNKIGTANVPFFVESDSINQNTRLSDTSIDFKQLFLNFVNYFDKQQVDHKSPSTLID